MSQQKRTELEIRVAKIFEAGIVGEMLEEANPKKFPLNIALSTLLRSFELVSNMLRYKELVPIVRNSNFDMLALEYSLYCLSSCTCFISQQGLFTSKEQQGLLLKQLFLARHLIFKYYSDYYPQEQVARYIKLATEDYMSNENKTEGAHSRLLVHLIQCVGRKNFTCSPSENFDFISGISFGAYVVGAERKLFYSFLDEINKTSMIFLDICFWSGSADCELGVPN